MGHHRCWSEDLVFRVFEESFILLRASEQISGVQPVLHIAAGVEGEAAKIFREAEGISKLNRVRRFSLLARPLSRIPRLAKAIAYYEEPQHKNDEFHKIIKEIT